METAVDDDEGLAVPAPAIMEKNSAEDIFIGLADAVTAGFVDNFGLYRPANGFCGL